MERAFYRYLPLLIAALLVLPAIHAPAQKDNAVKDRLHQAEADTSLDTADMKPWHLILSFQLFDAKGKQSEAGTIEEWWAAPKLHKTVYTSPSYSNTEITNEQGSYWEKADQYPPGLLSLLHSQMVHPMPPVLNMDEDRAELRTVNFGKVPLDCIALAPPSKDGTSHPAEGDSSYCFDQNKTSLRTSFLFHDLLITRNPMGIFQKKSVAIDQDESVGGTNLAKGHLEALTTIPLTATAFVPAAGMSKEEFLGTESTTVQKGTTPTKGVALRKVNPIYPESAKMQHISGTVILHGVIGPDGRIRSLDPIWAPAPVLAQAAITAVRQWIYNPYLVDGQPVSVETFVTVKLFIRTKILATYSFFSSKPAGDLHL